MVEKIQKWLNSRPDFNNDEECRYIFEDAIKCYINDIPRAAMQLSYVAFINCMRKKFLNLTETVLGLGHNDFLEFQASLQDEEKFEKFVAGLLDNTGPSKFRVFSYKIPLCNDFGYWRRIRNECAHYKEGSITLSTVNCFWNFLIDKSIYFEPFGHINRIILEYNDYYNITLTPTGTDDSNLFTTLLNSLLSKENLLEFISNVVCPDGKEKYRLLKKIGHSSSKCRNFVLDLLNDGSIPWYDFFRFEPNEISYFYGGNSQRIRKFWFADFQNSSYEMIYCFIDFFNSGLIPETEKEEFFGKLFQFLIINQVSFFWSDDEKVNIFLQNENILEYFKSNLLNQHNFSLNYDEINYQEDFYTKIIRIYGIDKMSISIADAFSGATYSFKLRGIFINYFNNNSNGFDKTIYLNTLQANGKDDPFGLSRT